MCCRAVCATSKIWRPRTTASSASIKPNIASADDADELDRAAFTGARMVSRWLRRYRFRRGDYLIDVSHRVNNNSDRTGKAASTGRYSAPVRWTNRGCSIPTPVRYTTTRKPSTKKSISTTWKTSQLKVESARRLDRDDSALFPVILDPGSGIGKPGLHHRQYPAQSGHLYHRHAFAKPTGYRERWQR